MYLWPTRLDQMYDSILSFLTAFFVTYLAIPSIIKIAEIKNLVDKPNERSSHSTGIPTLGGLAIFAGVIFAITFWTPFQLFGDMQYILCAFIIIFLVGAKDDIVPISPAKKMLGQFAAAFLLVYKSNVRLTSLYGIFGVNDIPEFWSILLSVFTIIVIINAFNLIDGINGLSGTIGIIIAITFGVWFYLIDRIEFSVMAFALIGALVAFLKFNYSPAKIFMGDTGSLLVGLVCSILAIQFIEFNKGLDSIYAVEAVPAVAIGIMIIPMFDTLRVFTLRSLKGKSPLHPDRTHLHHLLVDAGCSHMVGTAILAAVNIGFIFLVFKLQHLGSLALLLLLLAIATFMSGGLRVFSSAVLKRRKLNSTV